MALVAALSTAGCLRTMPITPGSDTGTGSIAGACGNGEVTGDEECDDGEANADNAACTSACAAARCGDGLVFDGVEECDDAAANADDAACTSQCTIATCGDGFVLAGVEACDDGDDNADTAACTSDCAIATCGDGLVRDGVEECDDGVDNANTAACTADCRSARCGDGLVFAEEEECEDGNNRGGDGCSPQCKRPIEVRLVNATARLRGGSQGDSFGGDVAILDDVSGDGIPDFLVGADQVDNEGAAYLFHGPVSGTLDVNDADATIRGAETLLGRAVASAGDINGDGRGDLMISSTSNDLFAQNAGATFVFFGPVSSTTMVAEDADVRILGEGAFDNSGWDIEVAGDVTGDNVDDLIIGAGNAAGGGGAAYILAGPVTEDVVLSSAHAKFFGSGNSSLAGRSVAAAGDVDGDGVGDVIIGAPGDDEAFENAGAAYVLFGPLSGTIGSAGAGAKLLGAAESDTAGTSVAGAGDVNGDGFDDVVIGAPNHDANGLSSGAAYLFYGPVSGTISMADADAILVGEAQSDEAGFRVLGAGDVNRDGFDDVLISAPGNDDAGNSTGCVYLVSGPLSGLLQLADADTKFLGDPSLGNNDNTATGEALSVGDVDRDGNPDFLFGGPNYWVGSERRGGAFFVDGGSLTFP